MNRINKLFQEKKKGILSVYFTAGYPDLDDTVPVIQELVKNGVDLIEIGMPFSDPVADGPVIQHSSLVALQNGMSNRKLFEQLKDIRQTVDIPLILMGYINPVLQYGVEAFCQKCSEIGIDGLIIPGGESTTIGKLMVAYGFHERLVDLAREGMPVYGTCAGMILLAKEGEGMAQPILGIMGLAVKRNAFGRQVDSFETELSVPALGEEPFHAVFIRAPIIRSLGPKVSVFAMLPDGEVVGARQGNLLVTSFHPELTSDTRLHEYFMRMT